jgi:Chaperone of endosialidase
MRRQSRKGSVDSSSWQLFAACASAALFFASSTAAQNVGLGVSNPQSKLSVNGTTSSGGLAIGDSTYTSTSSTVAPANGAIIQGSVGMGISTPQVPLHLNGQLYVAGSGVTGAFWTGTANQDGVQINPGWIGIQRATGAPINLAKPAGSTNNQLVNFEINNATIGTINVASSGNGVVYNTTSDERLKENIRPSAKGLNEVMKIQVSDYNFKSKPGQNETGFIAQELYTVLPNVVTRGGEDPAKEPWSVDYGRVTPLLTKAIQEQQAEIEILKEQIGRQDVRLKALQAENVRLQADADKVSVVEAENAHLKGKTDKLASKMEALKPWSPYRRKMAEPSTPSLSVNRRIDEPHLSGRNAEGAYLRQAFARRLAE